MGIDLKKLREIVVREKKPLHELERQKLHEIVVREKKSLHELERRILRGH